MKLRAQSGPTGATIWTISETGLQIMWPGPGAGLFIGQATTPGGSVTRVDHPMADGEYRTRREAEVAIRNFLASDRR